MPYSTDPNLVILPSVRRMPTLSDAIGDLQAAITGRQKEQQDNALRKSQADYYSAQTNAANARASAENEAVRLANAKALIADHIERNYKPLVAAGEIEKANADLTQFVTAHPDVAPFVDTIRREATNNDVAARNTAKYKADVTGRAASGSQDPIAVTSTTKAAFGDYLPESAFQQQGTRFQDSPSAPPTQAGANETKYIRRQAGDMLTAAQVPQAEHAAALTREANEQTRGDKLKNDAIAAGLSSPANNVDSTTQAVLNDPTGQTFFSLPDKTPEDKIRKSQVAQALIAQNGSLPNKGNGSERDRLIGANSAIAITRTMKTITDKWQKRGIPLNGRATGAINNLTSNHLGGATTFTVPDKYKDEYAQDVAMYNELVPLLAGQEARAALGRANQQYVNQLMGRMPNLGSTDSKLLGSYNSAMVRANQMRSGVLQQVWGGKVPPGALKNNEIDPEVEATIAQYATAPEPVAHPQTSNTVSRRDLERLAIKEKKPIGQVIQEAQQEGLKVVD